MNRIENLHQNIRTYISTFSEGNKNFQEHYQLKKEHTFRVVDEISRIGEQLKLDKKTLAMAETVALLHDIGRFKQYQKYQSFNDAETENHAEIAIDIIQEQSWIEDYSIQEKKIIRESILLHNVKKLPANLQPEVKFMAQLLRDADKIDILYVVLQSNIGHIMGLENDDSEYKISEAISDSFIQRKPVPIEYAQKLNDFRLVRASWIFDLNFKPSFICFKEREYIPRILGKIPNSEKLQRIHDICTKFMEEKIV
jgi:HD superfamily phosphodiesterase